MKTKTVELNVDFIGAQNSPLTEEEERTISDYIRLNKIQKGKLISKEKFSV